MLPRTRRTLASDLRERLEDLATHTPATFPPADL